MLESELLSISMFLLIKCYTENGSKEIFIIDSVLKFNPCTYKIKEQGKGNRRFLLKRIVL